LTPRSKPSKSRKKAPPERHSGPLERLYEILVVGQGHDASAVSEALRKLRLLVRACADLDEATSVRTSATMAVVLVVHDADRDLPQVVAELGGAASSEPVPIFVVLSGAYSDAVARRIYDAGAAAVFEWPFEANVLPTVVTDLLGALPGAGDERGDAALAHAARVRLRATGGTAALVKARVVGGTLSLHGEVDTLWKKERIVRMLGHVPGVVALVATDLAVSPSERADTDIAEHVRNVLCSASETLFDTVSVDVADGKVTLAGVVPNHDDFEQVESLVGNVEGVLSVSNLVTVSEAAAARSRGTAKQLQEHIQNLWPNADVTATVFGGVSVLRGHVRKVADRQAIERHVRASSGIDRVVNKVVVAP
jgi:osmotically-inducible protein OsmY